MLNGIKKIFGIISLALSKHIFLFSFKKLNFLRCYRSHHIIYIKSNIHWIGAGLPFCSNFPFSNLFFLSSKKKFLENTAHIDVHIDLFAKEKAEKNLVQIRFFSILLQNIVHRDRLKIHLPTTKHLLYCI